MEHEIEFIDWFMTNKTNIDEIDRIEILGDVSPLHKSLRTAYYKKFMNLKYKKKSYLYLTLSPDKYLRNIEPTKENYEELARWATKWFGYNKKMYGEDYAWVVETGSGPEEHPHIHALVEIKDSRKHAKKLKDSWKKTFPKSELLTTKNLSQNNTKRGEYCYLVIDDPKYIKQKLEYFVNAKKGYDHENVRDLGLAGQGGAFQLH
jgi:hypothetical protein